jgi:DUF1680 family protein
MSLELSRRHFLSAVTAASYVSPLGGASSENTAGSSKGVIDLTNSAYAKMRTIPVHAVRMRDGFWEKRMKVNQETSIPFTYQQMVDHGRFDNFARWDGPRQSLRAGFHTGHPSGLRAGGDSETYKWIEAASFALDSGHAPELRKTVQQIVQDVIGAQEPSGYLNTYFVEDRAKERLLPATQISGHEIYNLGHLIQAAVTYRRVTGDRSLLDASVRYVNDFLIPDYGPGPNQKPFISGHPEAEMALVELYRATGDKRHLKLAAYVLEGDSRIRLRPEQYVSLFCGSPFTSRTGLEGHAVRSLYACCGAADYYLETGDPAYQRTLETLWQDLVNHKMYITGGVGARKEGEAFGDPYELPNLRAYSESCGAIGNVMWNWRLLCATGEARFTDVMERALYNGVNAGTSLDGKLYNYCNPLTFDPAVSQKVRKPWYSTNCCPPNLERAFASIPGYVYTTAKDGVYVHLFDNSELDWRLEGGPALKVTQKTGYPWSGDVELTMAPAEPADFTVYVRIPGWSRNTKVQLNGAAIPENVVAGRYLPLRRRWSSGDRIVLQFDMTPRITAANSRLESDSGRVAIERGPIVYCVEQIDQTESGPLHNYSLALNEKTEKQINAAFDSNLLDGVMVLRAPGLYAAEDAAAGQALYHPKSFAATKPVSLKLIPYYAFANRAPSEMQVWIPYTVAIG